MPDNEMFNEPGYGFSPGSSEVEPIGVYTAKTFGWMALGLLVTFALAFVIDATPLVFLLYYQFPALPFIMAIAELIVVMVLSAKVHSLSVGAARGLFFLYAALNAVTFSGLFFLYDLNRVIFVFGITALYFGVLALYGYKTKRNLASLRVILFSGLIFLLLFWLVSMFIPMTGFERIACLIGLVVFMGYTAYDTQKIKQFHATFSENPEMAQKASIISALELYLDFINMFLYILRLLGKNRD